MTERMYTGETPDEFRARRAPLENLWNGFMGAALASVSIAASHHTEASVNMEDLLARAAALTVPAARVHELVAAERQRSAASVDPFRWETVRDQIDRECHRG